MTRAGWFSASVFIFIVALAMVCLLRNISHAYRIAECSLFHWYRPT